MTATVPYLEFQSALAQHQLPPVQLSGELRAAVHAQALRQWRLQERILRSPEAARCTVDQAVVAQAVQTIRARYPDRESYLNDLAANDLDETLLSQALMRELTVDAVLTLVTRVAPRVTEQDAEIFYWQHRERFAIQEARQVRHILITVNDAIPENHREKALLRINAVAEKLKVAQASFADLALRYSECPSALNGGELGWVKQGQLYPELDSTVFGLLPGEVSGVVESEMGFHLLTCEALRVAGMQEFAEISSQLMITLQARRDRQVQTAWLKQLSSF